MTTSPSVYQVKLDQFEGPLDLLLHLIRKNEMDIRNIEISKITDQYLNFMNSMRTLDVDLASEFIVMAATLIYIKSKMLLPKTEEEVAEEEMDPREALAQRLIQYQQYKWAAEELEKKPFLNEDVFKIQLMKDLSSPDLDPKEALIEVGIYELALAFQDVLARSRKVVGTVKAEEYSVQDKILEMAEILNQNLNQLLNFHMLFKSDAARGEVIVTFLSLLELTRLGYLKLFQAGYTSEIHVKAIKPFLDFMMPHSTTSLSEEKKGEA